MPPAHQWLHATTGRIATCPHSWMQAVHWTHGSGHYTPSSKHSPKFGPTTIAVAQEIAALKECRPSVDYLARKLKVSERTVQYHLGMLRETGLLVYRSKGTRVRGAGNQASVYERTIPTIFDTALGIRTAGEGVQRRPVGASPEHRTTLGKLAKKAARKVRRPRRRTPISGEARCTPMEGGTTGTSSAAGTNSPPESKLASGKKSSPTRKQSKRGPRTLNRVGRRYQLAKELITQVPWLAGASVARIAWIIRDVADAGWTVREVQAVAESIPMPAYGVKRPSGMLADRLRGKAGMTERMRAGYVAMWEESRAAAKDRHNDADYDGFSGGPKSPSARQAWDEAWNAIQDRLAPETEEVGLSPLGSIADLTAEEVTELRVEAMKKPEVVVDMIRVLGELEARRLYTSRLVDQSLAIVASNARNTTLVPAF